MSSEQLLVLAVDDNDAHRYAVQRMLRSMGYGVLEARTAKEALRMSVEHAPDVILMDVHLPDGNGIDVCRKIRANDATSNIGVVLHTATSPFDVVQTNGERAGADGFLMFPIEMQHLHTIINGVRSRRKPKRKRPEKRSEA
jgi:CheY-like chemotaxis protein